MEKVKLRKIYEGNKLICEIGVSKFDVSIGLDTRIIIKVDDIILGIERIRAPNKSMRDVLSFFAPERFMMNMQRGFIFNEDDYE